MTNVDSQRIKEIRDYTRAMAEAFGRIADTLAEALELYVSTQTETQNSNLTFESDRKTENCSEKPNNCEYAENPSGDVWECGCFLDTYCEHQIYDRNPDGTINIVECGYEPKDEPQTDDIGVPWTDCQTALDEPQTDCAWK